MYGLTTAVWLVVVLGAATQQPPAGSRDHAKAFAILHELGFPNVAGGKLVKLTADTPRGRYYRMSHGEPLLKGVEMPSGWLFQDATNRPALLHDLLGQTILLIPKGVEIRNETGLPDADMSQVASWSELSPPVHVAAVTNALAQADLDTDDYGHTRTALQLLFYSASLHQNGFIREAHELLDLLLLKYPWPDRVVDLAANALAARSYSRALAGLVREGDWDAFADRLDTLLALYGKRWMDYDKVVELAAGARHRVLPDFAELEEAGHPSWAVDCLRELAAGDVVEASPLERLRSFPWVLAPPPAAASTNRAASPLVRLLDGGMHSVPVLLAVATSDFPLCLSGQGASTRSPYQDPIYHLHERFRRRQLTYVIHDSSSQTEKLDRPVTLGELVTRLLAPLLPGGGDVSPQALREWYDSHRDLARRELALEYLKLGDSAQRNVALASLFSTSDAAARQQVESVIMDLADDPQVVLQLGHHYLRQAPKSDGRAFAGRLADIVEQQLGFPASTNDVSDLFVSDGQGRDDYTHRYLQDQLGALRVAATAAAGEAEAELSLQETIARLAAAEDEPGYGSQSYRAIHEPVTRMTPKAVTAELVAAARQADTPGLRLAFVSHIPWAAHAGTRIGEPDDGSRGFAIPWRDQAVPGRAHPSVPVEEEDSLPEALSLNALRDFWREMLADTRRHEGSTVQTDVAVVIETLYGDDPDDQYLAAAVLGDRYRQAIVARAQARVAGDDLPELPSEALAESVDRSAIERRLLAVEPASLAAAVAELDPVDVFALALGHSTNALFVERVAAAASRIVTNEFDLSLSTGAALTTNSVHLMLQTLRSPNTTNALQITVTRRPLLAGVVVQVTNALPEKLEYHVAPWPQLLARMYPAATNTAMVFMQAEVPGDGYPAGGDASVAWLALDEQARAAPADDTATDLDASLDSVDDGMAEMLEDGETEFWELAGLFCAATNQPLFPAELRLYRIPAPIWRKDDGGGMGDRYLRQRFLMDF